MAEKPYKIIDRRGYGANFYGNNRLVKAAVQTQDRKAVPFLDYDTNRNISRVGHRQLRSIGRFIYSNFGPVHGAMLEQAELSASTFIPQFGGADKEWGKRASDMLVEHDRIMDIRGWPYDGDNFRKNLVVSVRRDGDHATLLTENADGYPMIQVIPVHRIGNRLQEFMVVQPGSPYEGLPIINGVIVNEFGTPLAYRIYSDWPYSEEHVDVPAQSLILSYFPEWVDQTRGISSMASCAFDISDVEERRAFELLAQKKGASITLIEENESGEAPSDSDAITFPDGTAVTQGSPSGLVLQTYDGGTVRYIKNRGREAIKPFENNRPGQGAQDFEAQILRGAFAGIEWPVDFALDPTKAGGAQMRIVVEKVNSTIFKNQSLVAKTMRRIDGYRLSKFIKLGLLEPNPEWWKWSYQGPAEVTADRKYDSDIDLQEIRAGISTRQRSCAARGEFWQDVDDQKEIETDAMLERAQRLAKKYSMTIQEVVCLLNLPTPNGNLTATETVVEPGNEPAPEPSPGPAKEGKK